jgi:ribosomal protein L7/L12
MSLDLDLSTGKSQAEQDLFFEKQKNQALNLLFPIVHQPDVVLAVLTRIANTNPHIIIAIHETYAPKSTPEQEIEKSKADRVAQLHQHIIETPWDELNKLDCIKRYKEITGMGLKESKDWVDAQFHVHKKDRSYNEPPF